MSSIPKVSVVSITYNQEKYIREALESFIIQKTNFAFEIIVADDGSSDSTPKIIEEYAQKYPTLFKPILRKKNIGVHRNYISSLQAAAGEYVAICEGDDYWTDPEKLQRQVDFLDKHPDDALCFHPVKVFFQNNEQAEFILPETTDTSKFTVKELLRGNFIQTNSVMYRKQKYENIPENIMPLDWYMHLYHAQFGKIGFIDRVMSAYRRHSGGIWWDSYKDMNKLWSKHGLSHLAAYDDLLRIYGKSPEYRKIILASIDGIINMFIDIDAQKKEHLVRDSSHIFPEYAASFIVNQHRQLQAKEQVINQNEQYIQNLHQTLEQKDQEVHKIDQDRTAIQDRLNRMKQSKSWRYTAFLRSAREKL